MGERIINVQDLTIEILLHWRSIILSMFIGGIAAALFGYISLIQSSKTAQIEQSKNSDVKSLQNEMSQKELLEVEQVLLDEETFEKWHSYIENSVLMNLDPSHVYQGDLIYTVKQDEIRMDLITTYVNLLTTNKTYQFVADRTDDFTAPEIRELVNITNIGTGGSQNNSFNITVLAKTKEVCTAISEAIKSYIAEISLSISEVYGAHDIILLQEHISETNNISLLQKQIDMHGRVASLQAETLRLKEGFSEKQRQYYQLSLKESDGTQKKLTEDIANAEETPTSLRTSIESATWGMFFAVLIYVMAIFFLYISGDRLRYTDNCTAMYHVPALGHIPSKRTADTPFHWIDQKLYLLRDKRRFTSSAEEAIKLTVTAIRMVLQEKEVCGVCATNSNLFTDIIVKIGKNLQADGIEFQSVENILYSADSMNLLSNVKTAVLIEKVGTVSYGEIQQELEILRRQEINILGMVILE